MTYVLLSDLPDALAAKAIPFQLVDGWASRGRPPSTGQFNPSGVLCHHTASPAGASDQSELNVILSGNSEAPGPISQLLLGRQYRGLYVVAAGRANHAGSGRAPWLGQGKTDGNAAMIGIEVANNGVGERWPDWQTDLYARTVAALLDWYGYPLDNVLLHYTFSQPYYPGSKCDPAGPWSQQPKLPGGFPGTWDLDVWKAYIATFSVLTPMPPEPTPSPEEDFVAIGAYFFQSDGTGTMRRENGEEVPAHAGAVFYSDPTCRRYYWLPTQADYDDKAYMVRLGGGDDTLQTPVANCHAFGFFEGPVPHG